MTNSCWNCPRTKWKSLPVFYGKVWKASSNCPFPSSLTLKPVQTGWILNPSGMGLRMPELPEVETVRRHLDKVLPGRKVKRVRVALPRMVQNVTPDELTEFVVGRRFGEVGRRGKFL